MEIKKHSKAFPIGLLVAIVVAVSVSMGIRQFLSNYQLVEHNGLNGALQTLLSLLVSTGIGLLIVIPLAKREKRKSVESNN